MITPKVRVLLTHHLLFAKVINYLQFSKKIFEKNGQNLHKISKILKNNIFDHVGLKILKYQTYTNRG